MHRSSFTSQQKHAAHAVMSIMGRIIYCLVSMPFYIFDNIYSQNWHSKKTAHGTNAS